MAEDKERTEAENTPNEQPTQQQKLLRSGRNGDGSLGGGSLHLRVKKSGGDQSARFRKLERHIAEPPWVHRFGKNLLIIDVTALPNVHRTGT